jgi:hypothetical protein
VAACHAEADTLWFSGLVSEARKAGKGASRPAGQNQNLASCAGQQGLGVGAVEGYIWPDRGSLL